MGTNDEPTREPPGLEPASAPAPGFPRGEPASAPGSEPPSVEPASAPGSAATPGSVGAASLPGGRVPRAGLVGLILRRGWFVILIVIVAVAIALFRDRLPANASDLKLGECFDAPAGQSVTVKDVQHHPCTEPHTGEVFGVFKYPSDGSYPAVDGFDTFFATQCRPAFQAYTGTTFDQATDLEAGYFYPTSEGWQRGDRGVTCYLTHTDLSPLDRSMRSPTP